MKRFLISSSLFLLPLAAGAATTATNIITTIGELIGSATPVVVALAVLFFFYGLAMYILAFADETKKAEGRNIMIWGVVALFVMVSVWGLVKVLGTTLGIDKESAPTFKPLLPTG